MQEEYDFTGSLRQAFGELSAKAETGTCRSWHTQDHTKTIDALGVLFSLLFVTSTCVHRACSRCATS